MKLRVIVYPVLLAAAIAQAQPYPNKPVRLIVPYPPGGSTDFVGRAVGNKMTEYFGQQIVVDNRPGGGTLVGLQHGVRAAPDGYTITFGTSTGLAINPALGTKWPFDPQRDFTPVGLMVYAPYLLVVNPAVPAKNVKELLALAKAQPGKINFGSPGVGTPNHLGIEMLSQLGDVKFTHVPYKGGALAVTDLVAGRLQVIFSGIPQVAAFLKSGRLRAIATSTPKPNRVAPDMPTVSEVFPGFDCNTWYGLLVPEGTPEAIVTRIHTDLNRALNDPDVVKRLLDNGIEATPRTRAEFRQLILSETERWRKVIKAAGISLAPR